MTKHEAYMALQEASGLKVGDTVKVLRRVSEIEGELLGWGSYWQNGMDEYIGNTYKIRLISSCGVYLIIDSLYPYRYYFPFFVLQKIEDTDVKTVMELYYDLIYQVASKCPNESRHETAKRYIREREDACRYSVVSDKTCSRLK